MAPIGAVTGGFGAFDPASMVGGVDGGTKSAGAAGDATKATDGSGNGFANVLASKLQELNTSQNEANAASQDMATGSVQDVAQSMLRVEQANVSLQMATQVRNKMIDAYQEVIRMQI
jgi:flagellar hook-basal body complex protein FliE